MANSKLHDDLVNQVEPLEDVKGSIAALVDAVADRLEACGGDPVKLTDLKTVLREDPEKVADAVLANTPAAQKKTRTTVNHDAPSPAFQKTPENVRQGMEDDGHRQPTNEEAEERQRQKDADDKKRGKVAPAPSPKK